MRNDKLIPGMILVMIGAIFLLHNFGYIHFHWENIWHLWPIFLVIAGVNLVFAHNTSPWASILKIAVIVAGFALIAFGNFDDRRGWFWPHYTYHYNSHNDDNDNNNDSDDNSDDNDNSEDNDSKMVNVSGANLFSEPYNAGIKVARLNISGGANTFRLNDTTNQLFKADTKKFHGSYSFDHKQDDSVYVMNFKMKDNKVWDSDKDNNDGNTTVMSLNTNPEWEISIAAGATDLNFDLSKYKLRSVKLDGGAGQFVLKIGEPLAATNVNVSTGASDVTIDIPKDAACHIESSTGLSSHSFDGFADDKDGNAETAGFASAKNKIYIHFSGMAASFQVHRY